MKRTLTLTLLTAAALAAQTTYTIDPAHSAAQFKVRHMMISNVRGEFGKVSGTVVWNPENVAVSHVEATIDASSINTRNENRDKHLKSPDFFDVEKHPTLSFKSTQVTKSGGKLLVKGELNMHGVTRPVTLEVEGPTPDTKDPMGNQRFGATATATVSRKDWGLTWNKALEAGGVMVGDQVEITIDVEAFHKAQ